MRLARTKLLCVLQKLGQQLGGSIQVLNQQSRTTRILARMAWMWMQM